MSQLLGLKICVLLTFLRRSLRTSVTKSYQATPSLLFLAASICSSSVDACGRALTDDAVILLYEVWCMVSIAEIVQIPFKQFMFFLSKKNVSFSFNCKMDHSNCALRRNPLKYEVLYRGLSGG